MRVNRLAQILAARGIQGVVFPVYRRFDLLLPGSAWSDFSTVALNDLRLGEYFDLICPDYYYNMDLAWRELGQGKDRRVGVVLSEDFDAATNGLIRSCSLRYQDSALVRSRIPVLMLGSDRAEHCGQFAAWYRGHRPEVVVVPDGSVTEWMRIEAPEAEMVQLRAGDEGNPGVDECGADLAAAAIDCVADKIRRFQKGSGIRNQMHSLKGVWHGLGELTPTLGALPDLAASPRDFALSRVA